MFMQELPTSSSPDTAADPLAQNCLVVSEGKYTIKHHQGRKGGGCGLEEQRQHHRLGQLQISDSFTAEVGFIY